jgi:uncharacterized membrane protein YhaH (DUF805 family)
MAYLLFLIAGLVIIFVGLIVKEEVYRLSAAITGAFTLAWGFALTPTPFQILVEVIIFVSVFSICVRCWECS